MKNTKPLISSVLLNTIWDKSCIFHVLFIILYFLLWSLYLTMCVCIYVYMHVHACRVALVCPPL